MEQRKNKVANSVNILHVYFKTKGRLKELEPIGAELSSLSPLVLYFAQKDLVRA